MKKAYQTPELAVYGNVETITQGSGSGMGDMLQGTIGNISVSGDGTAGCFWTDGDKNFSLVEDCSGHFEATHFGK